MTLRRIAERPARAYTVPDWWPTRPIAARLAERIEWAPLTPESPVAHVRDLETRFRGQVRLPSALDLPSPCPGQP